MWPPVFRLLWLGPPVVQAPVRLSRQVRRLTHFVRPRWWWCLLRKRTLPLYDLLLAPAVLFESLVRVCQVFVCVVLRAHVVPGAIGCGGIEFGHLDLRN